MMSNDILEEILADLTQRRKEIQAEIKEQQEFSHESFTAMKALWSLRQLYKNLTDATNNIKKLLEYKEL